MGDSDEPRTRLEQVLRQRRLTLEQFRRNYADASGSALSSRQAYRWVAGKLTSLPYPHARAVLEDMFGEPVDRLFGPPYGTSSVPASSVASPGKSFICGDARPDWEGQLIVMSADRARKFLARAEDNNIGSETIDQLVDDVRRLAAESQTKPFTLLLRELVDTQDQAFSLLEGRQKPAHTRDLYFLAGIVSGFLAKASHDAGAPHDAMTQARAAYACADNSGHDGLRAWIRGLQSLVTYWSGRFDESVRYAQMGAEISLRTRGTAGIWLLSNEARSLAATGRMGDARAAITRASEARESCEYDELDEFGAICTFSWPTQLYYAADALAWGDIESAPEAEQSAATAMASLAAASPEERGGYGNEQGARCDLTIARLNRGEMDGAMEAISLVLELPASHRQQGIVRSVERARRAMKSLDSREARQMSDAIESFTQQRLALPER